MSPIQTMNSIYTLLFVSLLFAFAGCSGDSQVTGTVTFADGTPLTMGTVCFEKKGENFVGYGDLQSDGTYSMGKSKDGQGLPAGEYLVYIRGAIRQEMGPDGPVTFKLIAEKFSSSASSELSCQVQGKTVLDIEVTKP